MGLKIDFGVVSDFVARSCVSSSMFPAFVFRSFFRSSVVRLHTCCVNVSPTRLYNDS